MRKLIFVLALLIFGLALGVPAIALPPTPNYPLLAYNLQRSPNADARRSLLAPLLRQNPHSVFAILAAAKSNSPSLTKNTLRDILFLLAQNPSPQNNKLANRLSAQNAELLASLADELEPAAGPAAATPNFSASLATVPLENPNQISANQP